MIDWNDNISDEMLAAYLDGNATQMEAALIADSMRQDDLLSEAIDIVSDTMNMDNDLLSSTDLFSNSMNNGFEDWFPSIGMEPFSTMPDLFNTLAGNDGLQPLSNDNDLMNNNVDLTNNEH